MRPVTLLTIFAAVVGAASEMPGMDMDKGGDMDKKNTTMTPMGGTGGGGKPDDNGSRAKPDDNNSEAKPDESNGRAKPDDGNGGKPAKGGAGSLAPALLMIISAASLAVLVA